MTSRKVVVNKSTVPVGTADKVAECIAAGLAARGASIANLVPHGYRFTDDAAEASSQFICLFGADARSW